MTDSASYTLYQTRLNLNGDTKRARKITKAKRALASSFNDSPSYYSISLNGTVTDSNINDDSMVKEQKRLITQMTSPQQAGDIIIWNSDTWISLIVDNMGDIYYRGTIKKCVTSIKWMDSTGEIQEAYFTLATPTGTNFGTTNGQNLVTGNERRQIIVQNNADTLAIEKDWIFIFDNRGWRCTAIDGTNEGLLYLTLDEDFTNIEMDNLVTRVADYYAHTYTISITNGASASIAVAGTLQLATETKDNGEVVSLPVTYTSLTPATATVSSTGLITGIIVGTVSVKVALTADATVYDTISITVSASVTDSFELVITGSSFCTLTTSQTYSGVVKNNGVTDATKTILWTLWDSTGLLSTTLASISSQTTSSVTILANSTTLGNVIIKGTCIEDGSIVATKTINIKALI